MLELFKVNSSYLTYRYYSNLQAEIYFNSAFLMSRALEHLDGNTDYMDHYKFIMLEGRNLPARHKSAVIKFAKGNCFVLEFHTDNDLALFKEMYTEDIGEILFTEVVNNLRRVSIKEILLDIKGMYPLNCPESSFRTLKF